MRCHDAGFRAGGLRTMLGAAAIAWVSSTVSGGMTLVPTGVQDASIILSSHTVDAENACGTWGKYGGRAVVFVTIHSLPDTLASSDVGKAVLRVPQTDHAWTSDTSVDDLRMVVQAIQPAECDRVTTADGDAPAQGLVGVYREPGRGQVDNTQCRQFDVTPIVRQAMSDGRRCLGWRIEPETVSDDRYSARYLPTIDSTDGAFAPDQRGVRMVITFAKEEEAQTARKSPALAGPTLVLPVQKRKVLQDGADRMVRSTLNVPRDKVAFVTQHLWNDGDEGGPPVPGHLMIGLGTQANRKRGQDINVRFIRPALQAAREAGLTVVHSQPAFIANRYPQYKALAAELAEGESEAVWPAPVIPAYTAENMARWTTETWPGWGQMDFPRSLRPTPSEPVTVLSEELDHVLKSRGITTLIYVGYATDMCLINYTGGLNDMVGKHGYEACVLREATLATELSADENGLAKTNESLEKIERTYAWTASAEDFMAACRPKEHNFLSAHLGWVSSRPNMPLHPEAIDDQLLEDWKAYFPYARSIGFNDVGIWGLLTQTLPVPLGVDTPGLGPHADQVRVTGANVRSCRQLIEAAHQNDMRVYYGLCLYSWNAGDIGDVYPETRPGGQVLCAYYPGDPDRDIPSTQQMMKEAVDFIVEQLPEIDGFWISSADKGRCKCSRCLGLYPANPRGCLEYFRASDLPVLGHIRSKYPKLRIAYCTQGPLEGMEDPAHFDILTDYARAVDLLLWGNLQADADATVHRLTEACPQTGILLYQRPWQSTPPVSEPRDTWFMPNLVHPLGRDIHRRSTVTEWAGIMACPLPRENPADNVSLRFAARMMNQSHRDPVAVAKDILREVYAPLSEEALDGLYFVFANAETAFRERWPNWFLHIDVVPDRLGTLDPDQRWTPLTAVGYVNALQRSLARLRAILPELADKGEADRLESCLVKWIRYNQRRMAIGLNYDMP